MQGRILSRRALAVSSFALGCLCLPALAGTDSWSVAGAPSGGNVGIVVIDPSTPSTLYAVSGPGVYKSTDSGTDWTLVYSTPNAPDVLVVDPLAPNTLYAGIAAASSAGVIFKTTDGGATWAEADSGIGTITDTELDQVFSIALDPVNEGTLYASTASNGIYKSTDGGGHWQAIDTGISSILADGSSVYQMLVDPTNTAIVYINYMVFTGQGMPGDPADSGLYKSVDGGAHWAATGLIGKGNVYYAALDPADHTHLIACAGGKIKSSTDSGVHWAGTRPCPPQMSGFSFDPADSQHIYAGTRAGAYQSIDGGANFSLTTDLAMGTWSFASDTVTPANVYAATTWGVFKSADGGGTWAPATEGIHNVAVTHILHGLDGSVYMATAGTGIYKSTDQGASWSQVGGGVTGSLPITAGVVSSLVEDPSASGTLYAGTQGGLFKSLDGGDTWAESDAGIIEGDSAHPSIGSIAIYPGSPSILYAGGFFGVYKSVDGGVSWVSASEGLGFASNIGVLALAVDLQDSQAVYAGLWGGGIYKTTDGGAHWAAADTGIGATDGIVLGMGIDPKDSGIVYASTDLGFFKSTDAGATWAESDLGLGLTIYNDIQIDPVNPSIIYVSPFDGGNVFVSIDAGATWAVLDAGLMPTAAHPTRARSTEVATSTPASRPVRITSVALDPHHHSQLLASGDDGQVYVYDDQHPPASGISSAGGGSGGGSGGGAAGGSSGGGGFPLLAGLALLGFGFLRRRR